MAYELMLSYFCEELKQIMVVKHVFKYISELSEWIKENVLGFNYAENRIVNYSIVWMGYRDG